ncbi:aminoglycoside phosphotransferase family protein [Occultella glacieicola]|uniref:Aminoglycoside phosphotransferase family protein n=1 Tax=Occultella glacieicola TaxID=2518684 RepID=A0ABY2E822_9MICO|nr:phosphotransferase [Occultella glacieicola]TDE95986.1 aminoglycoside phosphotransferase family protein [Occultella glacieicola]
MSRTRLAWAGLPDGVRSLIAERTGEVVAAHSHEGGYSPGMAATLVTADGERVFVKAVATSFHERSAELYRQEAAVAAVLPERVPTPRWRWTLDEGDWVAVGFDAADGSGPSTPWRTDDLRETLELLDALGRIEAPRTDLIGPMSSGHAFEEWHRILESGRAPSGWDPWVAANLESLADRADGWREAVAGDALVHGDIRSDNLVRAGGRMLVVDWPYAASGAPWVDLVLMLPSIGLEGGGDPEEIWRAHPLSVGADPDAVTALVAAVTGFFVHGSLQEPPPGIPHLRTFQRAQGEVALAWLRARLG